jgi:hypothetical protein
MSTFTLLLRRKPFGRNLLKRQGCHFAKLIIEIVDNALADDAEIKPRGELIKEISALRKEVKELKDELKLKTIVLDKYEVEFKHYRSAAFLGDNFEGERKHNKERVEVRGDGASRLWAGAIKNVKITSKDVSTKWHWRTGAHEEGGTGPRTKAGTDG